MTRNRQSGVALLVALLVVALATVLIAALLDSGQLSMARTRNQLRSEQAAAYARGLEAYAADVLARDGSERDTNDDMWAVPLPPTKVTGGSISATVRDRNGCFNLNNMVQGDQPQKVWVDRFRQLLLNFNLSPAIAPATVDWIDPDGEVTLGGAEDAAYLSGQPPYRTADRPLADASELRLVAGVDAHAWQVLAPYVCALPTATSLNVNTASIPLLRSLAPGITTAVAAQLYAKGHADWREVAAFVTALRHAGVVLNAQQQTGLAKNSEYFVARARITLDGIDFDYRSLIQRRAGIRVVKRARGL